MQYSDPLDRASEIEAMHRADALAAHARRSAYTGPPPAWFRGVACCAECGEPLSEARRAAIPGVGLCVGCQIEHEEGGTNG